MKIEEILARLPEEEREAAQRAVEEAVADARKKGESVSGYSQRQVEKLEKEVEAARNRVEELKTQAESAEMLRIDAKKAQEELAELQKERERLDFYRREFEHGKFKALVLEAAPLADEAYLDHVLRVTGAKLKVGEKDGKPVYGIENADKLKSWVEDPENAHRIKVSNKGGPSWRPTAPPIAETGPVEIDDPTMKKEFESMPLSSQRAVLQRLRGKQGV